MSKPAPLRIPRLEDESDLEYHLRHAAEFIRAHAKDAEIHHDLYDEDETITGEIIAEILTGEAADLTEERNKQSKGMTLIGTLIQAGDGDEPGKPHLTIATREQNLKSQKRIPLYLPCEITFKPL